MMSEKDPKTIHDPEVEDLAHITAENEHPQEVTAEIAAKSNLRGCLQVLGAFFIFFNVWSVKSVWITIEL